MNNNRLVVIIILSIMTLISMIGCIKAGMKEKDNLSFGLGFLSFMFICVAAGLASHE